MSQRAGVEVGGGRRHVLALDVLPATSDAAGAREWAVVVATIAAWPVGEPAFPVVERRLWRAGARGSLRQSVVAVLQDPLGLYQLDGALRELHELLRPLTQARAMRAMGARALARLAAPAARHVAELRELQPVIPEGIQALIPLFSQLVTGLAAQRGPVALSLMVSPGVERDDEEAAAEPMVVAVGGQDRPASRRADEPARRVTFRLRLSGAEPLPAALRARAEAVCLTRRARPEDWRVARGPAELAAAAAAIAEVSVRPWGGGTEPAVSANVAAVTIALPEPRAEGARGVRGRPVAGPLGTDGPVLGRVPRLSGRQAPWRLGWEDRRHHTFIAGASGCGKTTTMLRVVLDDVERGRGVVLIDPHGDIADELAGVVPPSRLRHVDPRREGTAALDLLGHDPGRAASHLLGAASEVWPASFMGPAWQRAISLSLRALDATTRVRSAATLADVERFFTDADWRGRVIDGVSDGRLAAELKREHVAWQGKPSDDHTFVNWVSAKLTPLTQGPGRPLFGTPVRRPLEDDLRAGAVILVALPVGVLGMATTRLASRMFLTRLTAAIAHQGQVPEVDRRPVGVFLDEAHLMTGNALAGLFAQARKFNASVTVACQTPSQLEPHLNEVLTNAQTHLFGRLSRREALSVADRIGEQAADMLPTLPRHHVVVALENNDPDALPMVLSPVPPPQLSPASPQEIPPEPAPEPPSAFEPERSAPSAAASDPAGEPPAGAIERLDSSLAEIFPMES